MGGLDEQGLGDVLKGAVGVADLDLAGDPAAQGWLDEQVDEALAPSRTHWVLGSSRRSEIRAEVGDRLD